MFLYCNTFFSCSVSSCVRAGVRLPPHVHHVPRHVDGPQVELDRLPPHVHHVPRHVNGPQVELVRLPPHVRHVSCRADGMSRDFFFITIKWPCTWV